MKVIDAMQHSPAEPGCVLRAGMQLVDLAVRHCMVHQLPNALHRAMTKRLTARAPRLLSAFGHPRAVLDGPYFVSYGRGSFFRLHRDTAQHPEDPGDVQRRLLSLTVYLNGRESRSGLPEFDGGALVIHGPGARRALLPQAGMVAAFDSRLLHEVAPVRDGVRYAVIAWLLNPA